MARFHRVSGGLAAVVCAVLSAGGAAPAQNLPRLHVIALGQSADRTAVRPHEPFHVTIRVLVRERRTRLDELVLGDLENCTIVGDERLHSATAGGTEFVERLTLEASAPGVAIVSPPHLDAVDPATGRALRYSASAPVRVRVAGGTSPLEGAVAAVVRAAGAALSIAGIALAVLVVGLLFVRRRRAPPMRPPPGATSPPPAARAEPPQAGLEAALTAYRARRDPASLADLRARLFDAAGVSRGATLADALRRLDGTRPRLRAALQRAEDATFGSPPERERAADELAALDGVEAAASR